MTANTVRKVTYESLIFEPAFNARKEYEEIDELAESIELQGLLQPIGVTPKKGKEDGEKYFVAYGFRRYLAITKIREKLGDDAFAEMHVVITDGTTEQLKEKNLIENLDRKSLKPHEITSEIERMVNAGIEQRDIAKRLGRPQSWVSYHHKVATKLSGDAKKAFEQNEITLEQALNIADVPEEDQNDVVAAVSNADTRAEARQIAKDASKEKGTRRTYANKGRPTAKNLTQFVEDASFDSSGTGIAKTDSSFWNGVAAGIRVALGDSEYEGLSTKIDYTDTSFAAKHKTQNTKPKKPPKAAKAVKAAKNKAPTAP